MSEINSYPAGLDIPCALHCKPRHPLSSLLQHMHSLSMLLQIHFPCPLYYRLQILCPHYYRLMQHLSFCAGMWSHLLSCRHAPAPLSCRHLYPCPLYYRLASAWPLSALLQFPIFSTAYICIMSPIYFTHMYSLSSLLDLKDSLSPVIKAYISPTLKLQAYASNIFTAILYFHYTLCGRHKRALFFLLQDFHILFYMMQEIYSLCSLLKVYISPLLFTTVINMLYPLLQAQATLVLHRMHMYPLSSSALIPLSISNPV